MHLSMTHLLNAWMESQSQSLTSEEVGDTETFVL